MSSSRSPSRAPLSDADARRISRGVSRGSRAELGELFEAWFEIAVARVRSFTGRDESFALDVVQDAMIRAARQMPSLESAAALDAWMRATVRTAAIDRLRREGRSQERERAVVSGAGARVADPTSAAEQAEGAQMASSFVREATEQERAVMQVRYVQNGTLDHAGAATGTSGAAAHGRLRRLLQRLRGSGRGADHE